LAIGPRVLNFCQAMLNAISGHRISNMWVM
jgi:hypothetical protein